VVSAGGTYAAGTTVGSDQSRAEIERTLARYGATSFAYGWDTDRAMVGFAVGGRQVRFMLPLPDRAAFARTPKTRQLRSTQAQADAYEQAVRQRWRALALVVKAKLEAVAAGIVTFDEEFLAHLVLPGGQTVGEAVAPQLQLALESGSVPALLPGGPR
jgi:hypothetical protein